MAVAPAYDAVLIVSFGGPERPEDVMPFLERVTRGRNVPRERLLDVAERYHHLGGRSPINDQCRELIAALATELAAHGILLPVYWGNRNWDPLLTDAVRRMRRDGIRHALAYVTSAFGSYSGCKQYAQDIAEARHAVGPDAPAIDMLRRCYSHPRFIDGWAESVRAALAKLPPAGRSAARVVFTAHSIPTAMAEVCPYQRELEQACGWVMAQLEPLPYDLVYQSRSGPPEVPWLEPDILTHLESLGTAGCRDAVVVPIGFLSDHMEVVWDLDREARGRADRLGMRFVRAATPGSHPRFVGMVRELIQERLDPTICRRACVQGDPAPDQCAPDCCDYSPRRVRGPSSLP